MFFRYYYILPYFVLDGECSRCLHQYSRNKKHKMKLVAKENVGLLICHSLAEMQVHKVKVRGIDLPKEDSGHG